MELGEEQRAAQAQQHEHLHEGDAAGSGRRLEIVRHLGHVALPAFGEPVPYAILETRPGTVQFTGHGT